MPDSERRLASLLLPDNATIRDAMDRIDRGAVEIALAVDADTRLVGTVSDGDIRRALLRGAQLDDLVAPHTAREPHVVGPAAGRAEVLDLMRARTLAQIPVVDDEGRVIGLHVLNEVLGAVERPNWAVIMAGGRGTRLGSLTAATPKPMLPVAGRPILERLVLHLVGSGIRRILISVNYLGRIIEDHFGDGSALGCQIEYLREEADNPLGTAGSLALVADLGQPVRDPLIVMNGDLVTDFSIEAMLMSHSASGAVATVAAREYVHEVPFGVLEREGSRLRQIVEKPAVRWLINGGIYCLDPVVVQRVPRDEPSQLPALLDECITRGEHVSVWRCDDDWQDIGRPMELRRARGEG